MSRMLFVLLAVILFPFIGNTQEKSGFDQNTDFKSGSIIISLNKEVIEYKFKSFDSLNDEIEEIIKGLDFKNYENKINCEITIEIKLEIEFGINSAVVSEKITAKCTEESVAQVVKRFKAMLVSITMS